MLRPRIVVYLLTDGKGLVKTLKFKPDKYLGDPLNAIRIFNELEVDELVLLDIKATSEKREPNYKLISNISKQCRMPFGYGGGVTHSEQALRLVSEGAEKVVIGDAGVSDPSLISDIAKNIGSQSTVAVINHKKDLLGRRIPCFANGLKKTGLSLVNTVDLLQENGVGELVFYDVDRDGARVGFDQKFIDEVYAASSCPITVVGGASSTDDFSEPGKKYQAIGLGAGSLFTLVGKHKAPLINYSKP